MGKSDNENQLKDEIELDDAIFTTEIPVQYKDQPLKRERGIQKKATVLVMAEIQTVDNLKQGKKPKKKSNTWKR